MAMAGRERSSGIIRLCIFIIALISSKRTENGLSIINFGVDGRQIDRKISIMNECGHRIEIFWVHADTGELVKQTTPHVYNGASFDLNSFVGHTFRVVELPGKKTGKCFEEECQTNDFTVNPNQNQVFTVQKGMNIVVRDDKSIAREEAQTILDGCRKSLFEKAPDQGGTIDAIETIDEALRCVERDVSRRLEESQEEINFQAGIRTSLGGYLESKACNDVNEELPQFEAKEEKRNWRSKSSRRNYSVKVLHDRKASQIHVIEDFVSTHECKAIEDAAKQQAMGPPSSDASVRFDLDVPFEKNRDYLTLLSRRAIEYTNSMGQSIFKGDVGEDHVESFEYRRRVAGTDNAPPDQFAPPCSDGSFCTNEEHAVVSAMVMHCKVPEKGGSINFKNVGIYEPPKLGSAVYFSYVNNEDIDNVEKSYGELSSCAVADGEHIFVTQWIRKMI